MPTNAEAYHVFCEHNVDLGTTVHGMRREGESPNFDAAASIEARKAQYDKMVEAADALLADTYNPALITEITPWLLKMKYMGQRGQKMVEMQQALDDNKPALFLQNYRDITAIQAKEDSLISRNFEGTIKSARPVVASQKIEPFLKTKLNQLVLDYKSRYTEGWEVFPAQVLESGNYYIKYNGKYLYDKNASADKTGDYPVWADEIDDAQPQKCEWTITLDANTGRYKIVNTQDGRYLNENGTFWADKTINPYDADWHSYTIYRVNGKYAIQTTAKVNNRFMAANDSRIIKRDTPLSKDKNNAPILHIDDAIFEIVPVQGATTEHPVIKSGNSYYIKNNNGEYLTTTPQLTALSRPTFEAKAESADARQYQKWTVSIDNTSGRWKIAYNNQKFLDEEGRINKNAYYSDWNSVILTERAGLWAIMSVTPNAAKYWGIKPENTIYCADATLNDSYVFTFVDAAQDDEITALGQVVASPAAKANNAIYDLSGRKVSKPSKHGVYIVAGRKVIK